MRRHVAPIEGPLRGVLRVPGDKSMSHRAVLFAAMAEGASRLRGVLNSADVRSTAAAVAALGAKVSLESSAEDGSLDGVIAGWGERGPREPGDPVDCGNSGTTARLLLGVLAGWDVSVRLIGDESLSRRPMERVTKPLSDMGATFETTDGHLPVHVRGTSVLAPLRYASPVASAQVKTALLLAGLRANGRTTVVEPALSRDHTERMLPLFGVPVGSDPATNTSWVDGPRVPTAADMRVPGDPSSAAFHAVAAAIVPGSDVTLRGVSLNPTRTGFVRVLERMGADVVATSGTVEGAEPVGDLRVRFRPRLCATTVPAEEVPTLIDELPVLAVAASVAEGTTRFEGVAELRVKESDRLAAIVNALAALRVDARVVTDDVLEVTGRGSAVSAAGRPLRAAVLDSLGDHRLAMAWAIAGLRADSGVTIEGAEAVDVSYPGFFGDLESLARDEVGAS